MKHLEHFRRPSIHPDLTPEECDALIDLLSKKKGTTNQRGGIHRILADLVETKPVPTALPAKRVQKMIDLHPQAQAAFIDMGLQHAEIFKNLR
jgi:hypothetical protein